MKPFYGCDGIALYCDNCLSVMANMEDNSIDTVITDPPYGLSTGLDTVELLTHWLAGENYIPGSTRKGRKNCVTNFLNGAVVNNTDDTNTIISQEYVTFSILVTLLDMGSIGVKLDDNTSVREKEVNDESAGLPFKDMLMDKANSCLAQLFSNGYFMLRKREGFTGCVGVCSCFTKTGETSYSMNVRLSDDALANTKAAPDVVAFITTEMSFVLTLDLTGGTGKLLVTYGTSQDEAFIELVSTQSVGTGARTSSLTTPFKTGNIGSIDNFTDRACTFNLLTHNDLLERLDNPIIPRKGFMSKKWDSVVPGPHIWREVYRVMKPGATLLCFAGTRTQDLMGIALRLAGFKICDTIMYVFGSGFPKATDISLQIDKRERKHWVDICKAIDNSAVNDIILELWKQYLNSARSADKIYFTTKDEAEKNIRNEGSVPQNALTSQLSIPNESSNVKFAEKTSSKSPTEIGINMQKSGFAHEGVLISIVRKKSHAPAIIAELSFCAAHHTPKGNILSVHVNAEVITEQLNDPAKLVGKLLENHEVTSKVISIALFNALIWDSEKIMDKLKAEEALKIWLGSKKSSKEEVTNALCAALTEDLKRIILNQSKTFQNLDMTQQMGFVCATTVIITESIMERLISFTVNILRKKAVEGAGVEREVVGEYQHPDGKKRNLAVHKAGIWDNETVHGEGFRSITAPASPEAQLWDGWKSHGLKPAYEPIIVAMKPNEGSYAENALRHGVAGLWVDGGRIGTSEDTRRAKSGFQDSGYVGGEYDNKKYDAFASRSQQGRYPANLLVDGSEQVEALFPETVSGGSGQHHASSNSLFVGSGGNSKDVSDSGSASRFFKHCLPDTPLTEEARRLYYTSKASRAERNAGLDGMEEKRVNKMNSYGDQSGFECSDGAHRKGDKGSTLMQNHHPCVKPLSLMQYLVRISRTPTGGIVLDPFMGSGTTGVACVYEDREFIGIDLEPDYCEISKRRIVYALAQPQQPSFWSIPQTETVIVKPKQRSLEL